MNEVDELGTGTGTVWRDLTLLSLLAMVGVVLMLMSHINPSGTKAEDIAAPGSVIVEAHWPDGCDCDVDLWVRAPGDTPVGYSNKSGVVFNLLRDDLGKIYDRSGRNFEFAFSRGNVAGEYTVNLHLYRNRGGRLPIPVRVAVSVKTAPAESARRIIGKKVELRYVGQELTVVRFTLDEFLGVISERTNSIPVPLRATGNSNERRQK